MVTERVSRVENFVRIEVAQILQRQLKDPRVGFVTVTRVKVTPDLRHATIYFSILEGQGDLSRTQTGLERAAGFIRRQLAQRLEIRITPELCFKPDTTVAENIRISKLLDRLKGQRTAESEQ